MFLSVIGLSRAFSMVPISYTFIAFFMEILICFLVTLSLVGLFIRKLTQVYRTLNKREYNEETEFLMEPITKVTILCSISLTMTLINLLFGVAWIFSDHNVIIGKFCDYTGTMDLYTNFVCMSLCDKVFKEKYLMICSCLDNKCEKCWKQIVNIDDDKSTAKQKAFHLELNEIPSNSTAVPIAKNDPELEEEL